MIPATATEIRSAATGPPVRRCGPLALLVASLLPAAGSLAIDDPVVGAVSLLVVLGLLPLAVHRVRPLLPRLLPVGIAALSIGWSSWLLGGDEGTGALELGLTAVLRILVLVLPGAVLVAWLDPAEAGDHLAQRWRWPARAVVAAVVALGQLAALHASWDEIARARRARGLGPGRGPLAAIGWAASTSFGLLVDALRRAGRTSVAMDARGFSRTEARTWAHPAPWHRADTVLVLVAVGVAAVPVAVRSLT